MRWMEAPPMSLTFLPRQRATSMSWVLSWLRHRLYSLLGLAHKSGSVLLVGLDFAGKTTLLNLLKTGRFSCSAPTAIGTAEEVRVDTGGETLQLTAFDLGGHRQQRRVWRDYYQVVDAVVFMLDCTDRERLPLAAEELRGVLENCSSGESSSPPPPVAVLANKIDAPGAMGEAEVVYGLGLFHLLEENGGGGRRRPVRIFMCSLLKRQGFGAAFRWLAEYL